jgi:hypothetical protein
MGHTVLYDVTVTHPFKAAVRNREDLRKPGAAASATEAAKQDRYVNNLIRPAVSSFVPLGFDVFGGWGQSTTETIVLHLSKGADDAGSAKRVFSDWLTFQLSAAIWLYSSSGLCQRLRQVEDPDVRMANTTWVDAAFISDLNSSGEQ